MEQTLLEMAKDLTHSLVETGKLSAEDMHRTLQQAYTTLTALKAQEEAGLSTPMPASTSTAVDWRKRTLFSCHSRSMSALEPTEGIKLK